MQTAPLQLDFYKVEHIFQYPKGTTEVYSNLTARSGSKSNIPGSKGVFFFGLQIFLKQLVEDWDTHFFSRPKNTVITQYQDITNVSSTSHMEALHDLGYLPLEIKALPEGSFVPYGIPMVTIRNTQPDFYWVTNMLESVMSAELWPMITSITTSAEYMRVFYKYADITGSSKDWVVYQGHNFSYRGMMFKEAAAKVGLAHLASGFVGTDSVASLELAGEYYYTDNAGSSVPATEHSVMCAGTEADEYNTINRLITEVYPEGPVSIVCDTWDFWNVVSNTLLRLKNLIMYRNGKVIIRPDSGDPVKIICGEAYIGKPDTCYARYCWYQGKYYEDIGTHRDAKYVVTTEVSPETKGLIECLWDIFGGTYNEKGYKVLDPHIGAIYGDSITLERQKQILEGLEAKGFASENIVLGIGSYSFQYVTRDTHGLAIKATHVIVNDEYRPISKDPKTDNGIKKSAKGYLMVCQDASGNYTLEENVTPKQESRGCLRTIYKDGIMWKNTSLGSVRDRVLAKIKDTL